MISVKLTDMVCFVWVCVADDLPRAVAVGGVQEQVHGAREEVQEGIHTCHSELPLICT